MKEKVGRYSKHALDGTISKQKSMLENLHLKKPEPLKLHIKFGIYNHNVYLFI